MSPGGAKLYLVENHWYRFVSELSHPRGEKVRGIYIHQLPIIVKAASEGVKSLHFWPVLRVSRILGQRKLSGSRETAHSKKPPACMEIMRAAGMWAPIVELPGLCCVRLWRPQLLPRSAAWPGLPCSWGFAGSTASLC